MLVIEGSDNVSNELKSYLEEVRKGLINVAVGFAYEIADTASGNTPVGDEASIEMEGTVYRNYYLKRRESFGIEAAPGFHSGAWSYSNKNNFSFDPAIKSGAGKRAEDAARNSYKLGSTYYIGAKGPAFEDLEAKSSAQAPEGIMKPTEEQVTSAFLVNVKKYYDMS